MEVDPYILFPVPLEAATHPVLKKANTLAADPAAEREQVKVLLPERVAKVKTGDRRGALYQDADGVWWLLAAGTRKATGNGDFYVELQRRRDPFGGIEPTEQDARYRRLEYAYVAECDRERTAQREVLDAVIAAAGSPGRSFGVTVFGARVTVVVDVDEDPSGLTLSFDFEVFEERDRFPADVLACIPGYGDVNDWDYIPAFRPGDPESWYTMVDETTISMWAAAAELDHLLTDCDLPPTPVDERELNVAHYAPSAMVTLGYIEGAEITAICGTRFTPHRVPEAYRICPSCEGAMETLRLRPTGGAH
jgi:hypothetical protein